MRTIGFIHHSYPLVERQHVQWTQCNACTASKTTISVHDEDFVWTSPHGVHEHNHHFGLFDVKWKHRCCSSLLNGSPLGDPFLTSGTYETDPRKEMKKKKRNRNVKVM